MIISQSLDIIRKLKLMRLTPNRKIKEIRKWPKKNSKQRKNKTIKIPKLLKDNNPLPNKDKHLYWKSKKITQLTQVATKLLINLNKFQRYQQLRKEILENSSKTRMKYNSKTIVKIHHQ